MCVKIIKLIEFWKALHIYPDRVIATPPSGLNVVSLFSSWSRFHEDITYSALRTA